MGCFKRTEDDNIAFYQGMTRGSDQAPLLECGEEIGSLDDAHLVRGELCNTDPREECLRKIFRCWLDCPDGVLAPSQSQSQRNHILGDKIDRRCKSSILVSTKRLGVPNEESGGRRANYSL